MASGRASDTYRQFVLTVSTRVCCQSTTKMVNLRNFMHYTFRPFDRHCPSRPTRASFFRSSFGFLTEDFFLHLILSLSLSLYTLTSALWPAAQFPVGAASLVEAGDVPMNFPQCLLLGLGCPLPLPFLPLPVSLAGLFLFLGLLLLFLLAVLRFSLGERPPFLPRAPAGGVGRRRCLLRGRGSGWRRRLRSSLSLFPTLICSCF